MTAHKPRGCPTKLTPELAERLVGLLAGGATITSAAEAVGVAPRTLHQWRERAWSQRPQDRPYVERERRVQAARVEAAARPPAPVEEWMIAAARLEAMAPGRWGPVGPPEDPLDGW